MVLFDVLLACFLYEFCLGLESWGIGRGGYLLIVLLFEIGILAVTNVAVGDLFRIQIREVLLFYV